MGSHEAIAGLLGHPLVHDPEPASEGGEEAARKQAGANLTHQSPAGTDTADWRDKGGPGNLRVDYVLPAADLDVTGSGVFWPASQDALAKLLGSGRNATSDHRLVWVDIEIR